MPAQPFLFGVRAGAPRRIHSALSMRSAMARAISLGFASAELARMTIAAHEPTKTMALRVGKLDLAFDGGPRTGRKQLQANGQEERPFQRAAHAMEIIHGAEHAARTVVVGAEGEIRSIPQGRWL
jgi:hypothetical protein